MSIEHSQQAPSLATPMGQRPGKALKGLITAALLAGCMGSALAASQSFTAIGKGATDNGGDGSYDTLTNSFQTGYDISFLPEAYAFAIEFNLSTLPAGAVIDSVSLRLRAFGGIPGQTQMNGYVGDGSMTLSDMTAGSQLKLFFPAFSNPENHDVTSFVQAANVTTNPWVGFNLRQSPLGNATGYWEGIGSNFEPLLTVNYTLPAAVPEPGAALLMALGLGGLLAHGRRRAQGQKHQQA